MGGHSLAAIQTADVYDPQTNTWKLIDNPIRRRDWRDATLMSDGRVLETGSAPTFAEGRSVEIYAP